MHNARRFPETVYEFAVADVQHAHKIGAFHRGEEEMMDGGWGYLIGAAVTILGIGLSQWHLGRRDDLRWREERAAEWDRWKRESALHREDVERQERQRWVQERRALYAGFIAVTREWLEGIESELRTYRENGWLYKVEVHNLKSATALLPEFQLWASKPLYRVAEQLVGELEEAYWVVYFAYFVKPGDASASEDWVKKDEEIDDDRLERAVAVARSGFDHMIRLMQIDLGLASSTEPTR